MEKEQKYYAYMHIRLDTNSVFYVGVGTNDKHDKYKRSKKVIGRNPIWRNITAKSKYRVEILKHFNTKLESLVYETRLIKMFGIIPEGGQLANIIKDTTDTTELIYLWSKSKCKPIYQYTMEGYYVAEYPSVKRASEIFDCCASQISNIASGKKTSCKGFQWRYEKFEKIEPLCSQKKITYQYDLDGNFIKEWESLAEAAKSLNVSPSTIANVIKDRNCVTAANYQWRFEKFDKLQKVQKYKFRDSYKKIVYQYDLNMTLLNTFCGILEAEIHSKVKNTNISACCLNKKGYKTAGGFIWSYEPLT